MVLSGFQIEVTILVLIVSGFNMRWLPLIHSWKCEEPSDQTGCTPIPVNSEQIHLTLFYKEVKVGTSTLKTSSNTRSLTSDPRKTATIKITTNPINNFLQNNDRHFTVHSTNLRTDQLKKLFLWNNSRLESSWQLSTPSLLTVSRQRSQPSNLDSHCVCSLLPLHQC